LEEQVVKIVENVRLTAGGADPPASPERLAMAGWDRREKNSPRRCTEIHGFFNHEGHEEREENTRLTADGRRQTQTIRIRWKLYDELLAAKNKRASSYPPTALVSTQILGCLRYAECFQVILHTLPPTIMFE
jgi:hypothetical protein